MELFSVIVASGIIFLCIGILGLIAFIAGIIWLIASAITAKKKRESGKKEAKCHKLGPIIMSLIGIAISAIMFIGILQPMFEYDKSAISKAVYNDASNAMINKDEALLQAQLIERGKAMPINGENSWSMLVLRTIEMGEPACLDAILNAAEKSESGYDINDCIDEVDIDGNVLSSMTPLYHAVGDDYYTDTGYETISVLLEHGADPNAIGLDNGSSDSSMLEGKRTPMGRAAAGVGNRDAYVSQSADYAIEMLDKTDSVLELMIDNGGAMFDHPSDDFGNTDTAFDGYQALLEWMTEKGIISKDDANKHLDDMLEKVPVE